MFVVRLQELYWGNFTSKSLYYDSKKRLQDVSEEAPRSFLRNLEKLSKMLKVSEDTLRSFQRDFVKYTSIFREVYS